MWAWPRTLACRGTAASENPCGSPARRLRPARSATAVGVQTAWLKIIGLGPTKQPSQKADALQVAPKQNSGPLLAPVKTIRCLPAEFIKQRDGRLRREGALCVIACRGLERNVVFRRGNIVRRFMRASLFVLRCPLNNKFCPLKQLVEG